MKKLKLLKKSIFLIASLATIIVLFRQPVINASQKVFDKWMTLTLIIDHIERYYVTPKNPDELLNFAIDGVLNHLDPYSSYLSADVYQEWQKKFHAYQGIGLKYSKIADRLYVTSITEGGPAESAGIRLGDQIIRINDQAVSGLSNKNIQKLLSINESKELELVLYHDVNLPPQTFVIPRVKIPVTSIPCAYMLNSTTGYIRLDHFSDMSSYELDRAYAKLNLQGMKNMIFDLRDNGGGTLDAGIRVANRFIPGERLLVYTKGRLRESSKEYYSSQQQTLPMIPLVVLINGGTASDAEIVAGAIQDWDRGLIIGQTSFGKAMIQTEFPFQDGSVLLLTTAIYYTPLGRCIQKQIAPEEKTFETPMGRTVYGGGGIKPDIIIKAAQDTLPAILSKLYREKGNLFFQFADQLVREQNIQTSQIKVFLENFKVDRVMLESFQNHVRMSGSNLTDKELEKFYDDLTDAIRTEIAGRLWGDEGRYIAQTLYDKEIEQAVQLMPKAKELLNSQNRP
jgi:carboxyl-terminal processing protease